MRWVAGNLAACRKGDREVKGVVFILDDQKSVGCILKWNKESCSEIRKRAMKRKRDSV